MDKILHDLGGIILDGLPTFFLVLILAVFVKFLYLKPLEKVLAERFRLTEGARKAAEDSLKNADSKIAEYQDALNNARAEIYQEQAAFLQKLHAEQAELAHAVRVESDARLAAIKLSIAREADVAREGLESQSEALAGQIADAILTPEGRLMIIWQTMNFVILAGLLGWLIVKQGGPLLAARSKEIAEGLAAGEKAKAEADARAAAGSGETG